MSSEYLELCLKVLKLVNAVYNKVNIDIDFKYTTRGKKFYILEEFEDLECELHDSDDSYFVTVKDKYRNLINVIELERVGKFSLIYVDKHDLLDVLNYAYALREVNMKLLESIK